MKLEKKMLMSMVAVMFGISLQSKASASYSDCMSACGSQLNSEYNQCIALFGIPNPNSNPLFFLAQNCTDEASSSYQECTESCPLPQPPALGAPGGYGPQPLAPQP